MGNVITDKRGLVIILVIATVLVFVGLVWAIATYLPLNLSGLPSPSFTAAAPVAGRNCTYPVAYWTNHPELYPAQLVIGGQVYKAKDIGQIFTDDSQDTSVQLQAQLTGAYLNFLSGADQSYVETTIFEAYGWLVMHPAGSVLTDSEREAGTKLFTVLETYNQGLTEVASCEPGLTPTLTNTSTVTETSTGLLTMTPSQTVTLTPSETPSPTELKSTATNSFIYPTRTPRPTNEPTIQIPTDTPVQPTEKPTATNAPPPDTRTPTLAPPTPTFPPPTPTLPLPTPTLPKTQS